MSWQVRFFSGRKLGQYADQELLKSLSQNKTPDLSLKYILIQVKQTVNKNNIHVPVGVSQVSQLVVMILLINDCYVMSLVVIISRMNFVLYRNSFELYSRWVPLIC